MRVIEVAEYDPGWAERFERLRDEYGTVKKRLAAKPVIDIGSSPPPGSATRNCPR
jgi:hypothetical protein